MKLKIFISLKWIIIFIHVGYSFQMFNKMFRYVLVVGYGKKRNTKVFLFLFYISNIYFYSRLVLESLIGKPNSSTAQNPSPSEHPKTSKEVLPRIYLTLRRVRR